MLARTASEQRRLAVETFPILGCLTPHQRDAGWRKSFTGRWRPLYTVHASSKKGWPLPFRCPSAANLARQEVSSYDTHFSASEGQQFGENDQEESWREFRYSFQPFQWPTFRQVGQRLNW
jgi:hypothetical protein